MDLWGNRRKILDAFVLENLKAWVSSSSTVSAKYQRLEEALCELIAQDVLRPGAQLPADKVFAEQIGLSLGTVQKALGNLHKRGLLERAPKRGTSIAERRVEVNDIYSFRFRDPETGNLIPPRVRIVSISEVKDKGAWSTFLGTDRIICVERIMQVSVEPPVYSQVYLPDAHGLSLLEQPPETLDGFSIHRHMDRQHGAPTLRSENKVWLGAFTARAAQQLNLTEGSAALIWDVLSYTLGDGPAVFQRIQIPPNHRPLEFRRSHND